MPAGTVDDVIALFEEWGRLRYDEEVTQLEHALQCAALARSEGADDALVAAALLHDVGHLLELREGGRPDGQVRDDLGHERRGTHWLGAIFAPTVTAPIALHVAAKRYRCTVDTAYHATLSPGSQRSLIRQGGTMSSDEVARFEAHPAHAAAVRLRGWDDQGKDLAIEVPALAAYVEVLERLGAPRPHVP